MLCSGWMSFEHTRRRRYDTMMAFAAHLGGLPVAMASTRLRFYNPDGPLGLLNPRHLE